MRDRLADLKDVSRVWQNFSRYFKIFEMAYYRSDLSNNEQLIELLL